MLVEPLAELKQGIGARVLCSDLVLQLWSPCGASLRPSAPAPESNGRTVGSDRIAHDQEPLIAEHLDEFAHVARKGMDLDRDRPRHMQQFGSRAQQPKLSVFDVAFRDR